jgi:tetratricopeptide (TPR) repeat protein
MAEETEDYVSDAAATGSADAAATALALAGASRAEADEFLRKQGRLADLQIETLQEYEASHLRWRRFNDQMRGALQIMLVAVGAAMVAAIGAAIWNASRAEGFVIEAFFVPPEYAQRGLGGDIVAADITDKIASIRLFTNDNSFSRSKEVSRDSKDTVRVEIPETGVSLSEAWRYLVNWLGDERHLTGSLRDSGDGRVTLTLSVPGTDGVSVSGPAADFGKLEAQAAEQVYAGIDPQNYVNYLTAKSRHIEAMAAAKRFVSIAVGPAERSDSYALWTYTTFQATGNFPLAITRAKIGIGIDPELAATHVQLMNAYFDTGRYEEMLQEARFVLTLKEADQLPGHRSGGFALMQERAQSRIVTAVGDFTDAAKTICGINCGYAGQLLVQAENAARRHDSVASRALAAAAVATGSTDEIALGEARYYSDMEDGKWRAAASDAKAVIVAELQPDGDQSARFLDTIRATEFTPQQATAEAKVGDFAQAHRLVDSTPADCYACDLARGVIDAQENDPNGAVYWYRHAAADAPSVPFAYADWGELLLHRGDYDGAIAKFTLANRTGPHFADPLEMWGEALMLKNRSDLALAKFEEAAKYAPNWGRLHLKWGEALMYAGKPDEAKNQFAIASALDLSASDRTDRSRMSTHG